MTRTADHIIIRNLADAHREARDSAIERLDSTVYSAISAALDARADCTGYLDSNDLTICDVALETAREAVERLKGRL